MFHVEHFAHYAQKRMFFISNQPKHTPASADKSLPYDTSAQFDFEIGFAVICDYTGKEVVG
jgi:hypothetical protein